MPNLSEELHDSSNDSAHYLELKTNKLARIDFLTQHLCRGCMILGIHQPAFTLPQFTTCMIENLSYQSRNTEYL